MPFTPLNFGGRGDIAMTIDVSMRLRFSAKAVKELALTQFTPVVVSVDVENKRLGIAKQELAKVPNATTVRPDKRNYLGTKAGKDVCAKLALTEADLPATFKYLGTIDEGTIYWHAFELVRG